MYLGTILISFSIFFFEIVCSLFLNFSLGSAFALLTITFALMGIGISGAVAALIHRFPQWFSFPRLLIVLPLLMAVSFLGFYVVTDFCRQFINEELSLAASTDHQYKYYIIDKFSSVVNKQLQYFA